MRSLLLAALGATVLAAPASGRAEGIAVGTRAAEVSKIEAKRLASGAKGPAHAKDKTCCGYPLVTGQDWALRFYWIADQDRFLGEYDETDLYTREGFYLGSFPGRFVDALRMEGTGVLSDGRILNYHGRCLYGVGTCFQTMDDDYPYGRGAGSRALIPFVSVAIDPNLVPIGEPLYIPEFDGVMMPGGLIHDGCVRADDTGGAIKKRKMDFFVASVDNFRVVLDRLFGVTWISPQIEHPRCQYLRDQ